MSRPARTRSRPAAPARARIRMYRQGLGDCFLITLGGGRDAFRILIDCGVIQGTPEAGKVMQEVAADILRTTKGRLDLLIATHEHYDHLCGFALAEETFRKLQVDQVWLAWTEDPEDPLAASLVKAREQALTALRMGAARLRIDGAAAAASEVEGLLDFFGAGPGATRRALEVVRSLTPAPRYVRPTDPPTELPGGARIFALGPPLDPARLRKSAPSAGQGYGLALEAFAAAVTPALAGDAQSPFGPNYAIPLEIARQTPFFREHYLDPADARRRIDDAWAGDLTEMALKLDSETNNTSLAVAIELADGDVLLFAADAQIGSWLSWPDLKWETPNGEVTGRDLLKRTHLYKVGHHGSHNATLKPDGLELMTALRYALLPVDHDMAMKKRWGRMPLPEIVDRLDELTGGRVVRIDEAAPAAAGAVLTSTPLYYELAL